MLQCWRDAIGRFLNPNIYHATEPARIRRFQFVHFIAEDEYDDVLTWD
jgi:hypothetical protein